MFEVKIKYKNGNEEIYLEIIHFQTIANWLHLSGIMSYDHHERCWDDIKWVKINAYKNV